MLSGMSVPLMLLGVREREASHGYDLGHEALPRIARRCLLSHDLCRVTTSAGTVLARGGILAAFAMPRRITGPETASSE
jgi:hypothetical protein